MVDGLHCKAVNQINCLLCHSNESITNEGHLAAGYVTVGDAQDYCFKTSASCHDSGGASDATVSVTRNGDCALCQTTTPNLNPGISAGGGDCTTCHKGNVRTLQKRSL